MKFLDQCHKKLLWPLRPGQRSLSRNLLNYLTRIKTADWIENYIPPDSPDNEFYLLAMPNVQFHVKILNQCQLM